MPKPELTSVSLSEGLSDELLKGRAK